MAYQESDDMLDLWQQKCFFFFPLSLSLPVGAGGASVCRCVCAVKKKKKLGRGTNSASPLLKLRSCHKSWRGVKCTRARAQPMQQGAPLVLVQVQREGGGRGRGGCKSAYLWAALFTLHSLLLSDGFSSPYIPMPLCMAHKTKEGARC